MPQPDETRLALPKAYLSLAADWKPTEETAKSILEYASAHLPAYSKVRRIEFFDLPETISGKIRRVKLQQRELNAYNGGNPIPTEFSYDKLLGQPAGR